MADRHTLGPHNIEQFRAYLISQGYEIKEPVGDYEVLRATHEKRRHPIIIYERLSSRGGKPLVHYSVLDRDMGVVIAFIRSKKKKKSEE